MTRLAKLYSRARANPRGLSFREFERLLAAFGFANERTVGSHRHYVHPDVPDILTVLPHGKEVKPYLVRRLLAMVDEYGLGFDE
ncbi:type II toxin-antitoxin system HicA family toxin [Sphingomonas tabacisoli]|uniref:Type II toxin-antitoxin system HicA family toxin n=1 Tax=Sphingomonas tabacisoli TaxID=2249466 RepID=A0ABW4HYK4_9SPHN